MEWVLDLWLVNELLIELGLAFAIVDESRHLEAIAKRCPLA